GDQPAVALPEAGCLTPELPDSAVQAHLVDAGNAARVVVVLGEGVRVRADTDDRDAARSGGGLDGEPLDEEEPAFQPVEAGPAAAAGRGRSARAEVPGPERGLHLPVADQRVQAVERDGPLGQNVPRVARVRIRSHL